VLSDPSGARYTELKLDLILETLGTLRRRIEERFPGSGLGKIAADLLALGLETAPILERARKPHTLLRVAAGAAIVLVLALGVGPLFLVRGMPLDALEGVGALVQAVEAAAQVFIFLAIAIWFLVTIETRVKRASALAQLHRLRSVVHVVDMHQLTKDPEHVLSPGMATPSSPDRALGRFELTRYLDYCSELLAITSKLAALHAQMPRDPVVLDAVSDIEVLSASLSNKIWQKIMILDTALRPDGVVD
jgi:hypothetical protein